MMVALIIFVVAILASGLIGYWIGSMKGGRENDGALLGALLGPIGWIIAAILPTKKIESMEHPKFAKGKGGEWGGGVVIPNGVKVRCPNCGEEGSVRPEIESVVCPTCKEKFSAQSNLARA